MPPKAVESLPLDVDSSDSIAAAVDEVLRRTGGAAFTPLINNGAFGLPGAVEDLNREALRAQLETNVFGTQELTNLIRRPCANTTKAASIQISSLLGIVCPPIAAPTAPRRFALEALTDTMRLELRDTQYTICR